MNRRQIIKQLGIAGGAAVLAPSLFTNCSSEHYQLSFLTEDEFKLLDELADFTLPVSEKSPGARQAQVANFIDRYISVCYTKDQKLTFQQGIVIFRKQCYDFYNKGFVNMTAKQKGQALRNPEILSKDFFKELKQLILFGYFTSQEGVTQALEYVAIPGKYDGDINYEKGNPAWAF